eukprot:scaffold95994_cov20-Tisochrysis_lutea.AAC.1
MNRAFCSGWVTLKPKEESGVVRIRGCTNGFPGVVETKKGTADDKWFGLQLVGLPRKQVETQAGSPGKKLGWNTAGTSSGRRAGSSVMRAS